MVGMNCAAGGHHTLDAAVLDHQRLGRGIGESLQLPVRDALVDELARDRLRAGDDQAGVRVPEAALDQLLLDQREFLLDLRGVDQPRAGAERLGRVGLAPDLVHADVVPAQMYSTADLGVVPHPLVEPDGIVLVQQDRKSWLVVDRSRRHAPSSRCRSGCRICRCRQCRPSCERSGDRRRTRPRCHRAR